MKKIFLALFLTLALFGQSFALNLDLTTYTEVDPSGDFTVAATSVTVDTFSTRGTTAYIYDTQAVGNFKVKFKVQASAIGSTARYYPISFTNNIGDAQSFSDSFLSILLKENGGALELGMTARISTVVVNSSVYTYTLNEEVWCVFEKFNTTLTCDLYSTQACDPGDLLQSLSIPTTVNDSYQYVVVSCGNNTGGTGVFTGAISEVEELALPSYDLTVTINEPSVAKWYANDGTTTFGPFSSGTQSLTQNNYTITTDAVDGFRQPNEEVVNLNANTSITLSYFNLDKVSSIARSAQGAWILGNRFFDITDNGNTLTQYGTVTSVTDENGRANAASDFTGVADLARLETGADPSFDYPGSFTVAGRGNLNSITSSIIGASWQATEKIYFLNFNATGLPNFVVRNASDVNVFCTGTTPVLVGANTHLAGVYDAGAQELRLYVDGILEATTPFTGSVLGGVEKTTIGNYTEASALFDRESDLVVDDFLTISGVLTQPQIAELAALGSDFENLDTGTLNITMTGPSDIRFYLNDGTYTTGPFIPGSHDVKAGTYTVSFNDTVGYLKPANLTGVVVTESLTTNESATYTAYPSEVYVRPAGGSYGTGDGSSYANAFAGFDEINQTEIGLDGFIRIRGTHKETLVLSRRNLKIDGGKDTSSDPGAIEGALPVETSWTEISTNLYRTQVGTPNVDYMTATEPVSPSVGERWYRPEREIKDGGDYIANAADIARIWDGEEWKDDPTWFLMPEKLWVDGKRVNMSRYPTTGFISADTMTLTTTTDTLLSAFATDELVNASFVAKSKGWVFEDKFITGNTGSSVTYTELRGGGVETQSQFYIENIPTLCTSHKQWAYDFETGFLYIYLDTAPSNYTIEYSSLSHGVYSYGFDDISVEGLKITRTNDMPIKNWEGDNPSAVNNTISDFSCRGAFSSNGSGIDFRALDPWNYNILDIYVDGSYSTTHKLNNVTIEYNTISESRNGSGVNCYFYSGGSVDRNKIFNIGYSEEYAVHGKARCVGIELAGCDNISGDYNIVANTSSSAVILTSSQNMTVLYNISGNSCRNHQDLGAFYLYGNLAYGNEIAYNISNDVIGSTYDDFSSNVAGIYTDGGPTNGAYNNSIHDNISYYILGGLFGGIGLFNNNTGNTPPNVFEDNTIYEDSTILLERNTGTATNATFSGTQQLAESAYQLRNLTVTTNGGTWSVTVNGTTTAYASETTQSLPEGAYVITYEDSDIIDEVIALTADTVLDRRTVTDNPALLMMMFE